MTCGRCRPCSMPAAAPGCGRPSPSSTPATTGWPSSRRFAVRSSHQFFAPACPSRALHYLPAARTFTHSRRISGSPRLDTFIPARATARGSMSCRTHATACISGPHRQAGPPRFQRVASLESIPGPYRDCDSAQDWQNWPPSIEKRPLSSAAHRHPCAGNSPTRAAPLSIKNCRGTHQYSQHRAHNSPGHLRFAHKYRNNGENGAHCNRNRPCPNIRCHPHVHVNLPHLHHGLGTGQQGLTQYGSHDNSCTTGMSSRRNCPHLGADGHDWLAVI